MRDKIARFTRFFVGIISILALLPAFYTAGEALDPRGNFRLPLIGALYLGEWWLAALVYELGHALAAYNTGRRIHMVAVLPLGYLVKAQKFTWISKGGTGDIGGFVFATPKHSGDWRRGEVLYALGGILANLLSSALAFFVIGERLLGRGSDPFVGSFAVLSLVIAFLNLVPIWGPGLLRSDGAFLLDAMRGRGNPGRDRLSELTAMHVDGVPAADWDAALVRQIENRRSGRYKASSGCKPVTLYTLSRH